MLSDEKKPQTAMSRLHMLQSFIHVMWQALDKSADQDLTTLEVQHLGQVARFAYLESDAVIEAFQLQEQKSKL